MLGRLPFLVLLLAVLPLLAIAYLSRAYPSRDAGLLLIPACVATFVMLLLDDFVLLVVGVDIAVLLVAAAAI